MSEPRYRIGPLTTYVDLGDLRVWHQRAAVGDELTYAIGPALGRGAAVAAAVRGIADAGGAQLFQRREGKAFAYVMRKQVPAAEIARDALPERAAGLLSYLADCAERGVRCPSDGEIATALTLRDRHDVAYRMRLLRQAGAIRVEHVGGGRAPARVVTIVLTGARTAMPGHAAESRSTAQ